MTAITVPEEVREALEAAIDESLEGWMTDGWIDTAKVIAGLQARGFVLSATKPAWFSWVCPECGTSVTSRYLLGAEAQAREGRLKRDMVAIAKQRNEAIACIREVLEVLEAGAAATDFPQSYPSEMDNAIAILRGGRG